LEANVVHTTGAESVAGVKTFTNVPVFPAAGIQIGTDTNLYQPSAAVLKTDSYLLSAVGITAFGGTAKQVDLGELGPGAQGALRIGGDAVLYRGAATVLRSLGDFVVDSPSSLFVANIKSLDAATVTVMPHQDAASQLRIQHDAATGTKLVLHSAAGVGDVSLHRSAAGVIKTDDSLHVGTDFRHLGTNLGFYNATATAKPTVTGSRAGNAALASLLAALATVGLIADSTTA
jgi:hypothetical protein